jgi:hypothetical protein
LGVEHPSQAGEHGRLHEKVDSVTATFYEVWDDGTGNRVGGSFATIDEARALLADVLDVSGPDVASEMAILAFHPTEDGRYEPATVLEGHEFVTQVREASKPSTPSVRQQSSI